MSLPPAPTPLFTPPNAGGPVDICFHGDLILIARQLGPVPAPFYNRTSVMVDAFTLAPPHSLVWQQSWDVGTDVGSWPRLFSTPEYWWVGYREGKSLGGQVVLRRSGIMVYRSIAEAGGNHPLCLGYDVDRVPTLAWQRFGDNYVTLHPIDSPDNTEDRGGGFGSGAGLSHFDPYGHLVLTDNALSHVPHLPGDPSPGLTYPSFAGSGSLGGPGMGQVIAGEHPDGGVILRVRLGTGEMRQSVVWAGQETYRPRIAMTLSGGLYAVTTWGRRGIPLATFRAEELEAIPAPVEVPPVVPYPPGAGWTPAVGVTRVDVRALMGTSYALTGMPPGVPLNGNLAYTHDMWQYTHAPNVIVTGKRFADRVPCAVWVCSDTHRKIGLTDDESDAHKGYRVVNQGEDTTAFLYDYVMEVGQVNRTRVDILDRAGNRTPVIAIVGVKSVWDGPGGRWVCLTWDFDHVGYHEEMWFLLGVGQKMWVEIDDRTNVVTKRAYFWSPMTVAPPPLNPQFTDRFPRPPKEPTMPKADVLTREQANIALTEINDLYKTELKRPGGMVIDDAEGVARDVDIEALKSWVYSTITKELTVAQVLKRLRASDEWKSKHPGEEPPPPPFR